MGGSQPTKNGGLVEEFLTWLAVERGRAPSTLEAYRRELERYAAFLDDFVTVP